MKGTWESKFSSCDIAIPCGCTKRAAAHLARYSLEGRKRGYHLARLDTSCTTWCVCPGDPLVLLIHADLLE